MQLGLVMLLESFGFREIMVQCGYEAAMAADSP